MKNSNPLDLELGKVPPQSIPLEDSCLGALLLEPEAIIEVIDILKPESFYKEAHQKIYEAILDLYINDRKIDLRTVTEQLRKKQILDEIGGPVYISGLMEKIASASHVDEHARIVQEKFLKRELIRIGTQIQSNAYDDSVDIQDLLDYSNRLMDEINELQAGKTKSKELGNLLNESVNQAIERKKVVKEGKPIGIEPPLTELKKKIYYWVNDLIILAARPSEGKTNLALHIAKEAASQNKNVCIYSLETDSIKLSDRYLLAESHINDYDFKSGHLTEKDIDILKNAAKRLGKLPIYIDDNPVVSCDYIKNHSRMMYKKEKCDMIIIDYIQLTDTSIYKHKTREQEISLITRTLKTHARNMQIPIIALSQLNREIEKRQGDNRKPRLSDLRESGAIEMDSYMVLFLWRPERYDIDDYNGISTQNMGYIIIAKNKDGEIGEIPFKHKMGLRYISDYNEFDEKFNTGKSAQYKDNDGDESPFNEIEDLPF